MSGFQEIMVIGAILLLLFFIPRVMPGKSARRPAERPVRLSVRMRLAIAVSVVYPAVVAAVYQPWRGDAVTFIYTGVGPVALGWLLYWVLAGLKKT